MYGEGMYMAYFFMSNY